MDKICKNCKFWNNNAVVHSDLFPGGCMEVSLCAITCFDMSCPRWEAKEAEIPERLKGWVPVWHSVSDKPEIGKKVLSFEKIGCICESVWWGGAYWIVSWNRDCYGGSPDYWTELP